MIAIGQTSAPSRYSRRWAILFLAALMLATGTLTLLGVRWRRSLKVEKLVIEGCQSLSESAIIASANIPMNTPMADVDLAEIEQGLARQPYIRTVQACREFPDRVCLTIEEREPIALVNVGAMYYIDADAVLLPTTPSAKELDVPVISGLGASPAAQPGKTLQNRQVADAIQLYRVAQELDSSIAHMISEINMNNGGDIVVYAAEGGIPIIVGRGDFGKKLVALESFWHDVVRQGGVGNIEQIDLRFEDQVVVRRHKAEDKPGKRT